LVHFNIINDFFLISVTYVSDINGKIEMPLLIIDISIIIIFIIGYSE